MNRSKKATILLIIGTLFWGMTFVFIKEGLNLVDLYLLLALRFLIAGGILFFLFLKQMKKINGPLLRDGLILTIPFALGYFLQTYGLQFTSATKSGFITGLCVVTVPIYLIIWKKQIPTIPQIFSVMLATAGLGYLTLSDGLSLSTGDLWTLLGAFAFGLHVVLISHYSRKHPPMPLAFIQIFTTGFLNLIITVSIGRFTIPTHYIAWQAILFTAIFATAFTYGIQNRYQKEISEVKAAVIYSLEPLFGALTAFIYLGESIPLSGYIGGFLICFGMIISDIKFKPVVTFLKKSFRLQG